MFDEFDKLVEKIKRLYTDENTRIKVTAKQAQEQADRIKATMKQQQALIDERNKELQEISHERDLLKR